MRVRVDDISLFFDVISPQLEPVGDRMVERPTLLLLHGGPGFDHTHFRPAFDTFSNEAQVVLFDQRGQGRSDRSAPARWNLDTWADDVAEFCRALDIRRPIIVGASFGGFVALATAARWPELVGGLVLIGTAARVSLPRIVERFGELGGPAARDAATGLFEAPGDPARLERFMEVCFPLYALAGIKPEFGARSIATFDVLAHFFQPGAEYANYDLRERLAGISIPTLILHGQQDPIVPIEFARETAALFPPDSVQLHEFAACAHDVPSDVWDEAEPLIRKFIHKVAEDNR